MRAQPNADTRLVELALDDDGEAFADLQPGEAIVLGRQLLAAGLALELGSEDTGFSLGITLEGIELR